MIRPPAEQAVVEATFRLHPAHSQTVGALLSTLGIPSAALPCSVGQRVRIRREIARVSVVVGSDEPKYSGDDSDAAPGARAGIRSRCFINGAATQLRVVRQLGAALVDVNGQNASLSLRSSDTQLALLDTIAGTTQTAAAFSKKLARLRALRQQLEEIEYLGDEEQRAQDQAYVDEIFGLELHAGEEDDLRNEIRAMDGRVASVRDCAAVHAAFGSRSDEGSLLALLSVVQRRLETVQKREGALAAARPGTGSDGEEALRQDAAGVEMVEQAQVMLYEAEEYLEASRAAVQSYLDAFEFDEGRYDAARRRLDTIGRLLKDTDCRTVEELLNAAEHTSGALEQWAKLSGQLPALRQEQTQLAHDLQTLAVELSRRRRKASGRLRQAVEHSLSRLAMAHSRFDVRVSWDAHPGRDADGDGGTLAIGAAAEALGERANERYRVTETGLDRIEFLLAAGPAEPLRLLRAVASGGESARIMLALKAAPLLTRALAGLDTLNEPGSDGREGALEPQEHPQNASGAALTPAGPPGSGHGPNGRADGVLAVPAAARRAGDGYMLIESPDGGHEMFPMTGEPLYAADTSCWDGRLSALGTPVMVLDEIDSGVGSRLGSAMGSTLRAMARCGQILCVSHVPQVAAHAQFHVKVEKSLVEGGRPETRFVALHERAERVREVAAMVGLGLDVAERLVSEADGGWGNEGPVPRASGAARD